MLSDKPTAQYTLFNSPTERRYVKANFDAVTDDVVLAPQPVVTPVEPTPEHKIVVEFAGQWGHNDASLLLSKTVEQYERITKPRADPAAGHRSVAIFKDLDPEPRNLYLTVTMKGIPQPLKLLLAENVQPVEKTADMPEWDNVLVPVVPMKQEGETYSLHETGFFYVIWKAKVWREILIDAHGYFCDIDIHYQRKEPLATRHVNIDAAEFFPENNLSLEKFELYQQGKKVFTGELDICEQARVFNLVAEEVELRFIDFEHDEIIVATHASPMKSQASKEREASGYPLPHVWLPYKILGEVQEDCYLYYSAEQLSDSDITSLEGNYQDTAVAINEMSAYSQQQMFTGEKVYAIPTIDPQSFASYLANTQAHCNIAAMTVMSPNNQITLRYRVCATTDQPDDFFMLENEAQAWSQKVYLREAKPDAQGFLNLSFSGWPKEVEEVDIIRGASGDLGTTDYELITLKTQIKISELIG